MELRQMPEIKRIAEYLRGMKFKKKLLGGCDTESVLDHFAVVSEKYEDIILNLMERYEQNMQKNAALGARIEQQAKEIAALQSSERQEDSGSAEWRQQLSEYVIGVNARLSAELEQLAAAALGDGGYEVAQLPAAPIQSVAAQEQPPSFFPQSLDEIMGESQTYAGITAC